MKVTREFMPVTIEIDSEWEFSALLNILREWYGEARKSFLDSENIVTRCAARDLISQLEKVK